MTTILTMQTPRILRIPVMNGKGASAKPDPTITTQARNRVLIQSSGGTGLHVVTHHKAIGMLEGSLAYYCHYDSDHGESFQTTLPDGANIMLDKTQELCLFGVDDPRATLRSVAGQQPAFTQGYHRRMRGITVAQTNQRGAAQIRPIGLLQYDLGIERVITTVNRALDQLYPPIFARGANLAFVQASQAARVQAELPLIDLHIASGMGGQGSATFLTHAYVSRWLMDKRKAKNVTRIGVLLGPRAFKGRGNLGNYAAALQEIDRAYREGFRHMLRTGEVIEYAAPPFDLLFLVDLPEWPPSEGSADTEGAKLSDSAMDDWLRQVALGLYLLTQRTMHDRLQSVLLNMQSTEIGGAMIGTFSAALVNSNLRLMEQAIAWNTTRAALQALVERCNG